MNINENAQFIEELKNKTGQKNITKRIHYYSYINLKNGLQKTYSSDINKNLLSQLEQYEKIISELDHPISNLESHTLFKKFIYPAGYHLERKSRYGFISNYNLHLRILAGIIADIIIWFLLSFGIYLPIFLIYLITRGLIKRKTAKKEGRYFSFGY